MNQNECVEKPALKLFIHGQPSGNPDDWTGWGMSLFVVARDSTEAARLCNDFAPPSTFWEIDLRIPRILDTFYAGN
jgi:hypothetical protein